MEVKDGNPTPKVSDEMSMKNKEVFGASREEGILTSAKAH